MKELAAVSAFSPDRDEITLLLFIHLTLPIREVRLRLQEPESMMQALSREIPECSSFSPRMRTHLVAMFHEAMNCHATGNPPENEVNLLLALIEDTGEDLTTLYQKQERKVARLNRLLLQLLEEGKPRFVFLLFDKLLNHAPEPVLMDRYVHYCSVRNLTDRVLPWLDWPVRHDGCREETIAAMSGIAIYHKRYEEAEALCDAILKRNYGNVQALIGKAQCRYQLGNGDYRVYLQKAFNFNKRITVETVCRRFEFRKDTRMDMFDVISLKDGVEYAGIPGDALKRKDMLSLPFRTETIQGSIYFVREELESWKSVMQDLSIESGRFGG